MDPKVVEMLDHWNGWDARKASESMDEAIDPLDNGKKVDLVAEKAIRVEILEIEERL